MGEKHSSSCRLIARRLRPVAAIPIYPSSSPSFRCQNNPMQLFFDPVFLFAAYCYYYLIYHTRNMVYGLALAG
ncbi:hypothetical protein BJX96DRAFT_153059 [Aspergillus floccosus]